MARRHAIEEICPNCGTELDRSNIDLIFWECSDCGEAYTYKELLLSGQKTQETLADFGGDDRGL